MNAHEHDRPAPPTARLQERLRALLAAEYSAARDICEKREKAIGKAFKKPGRKKAWTEALEQGWTVRLVYMRLFVPVFHATTTGTEMDDLDDED